jgi:hypothetical protein
MPNEKKEHSKTASDHGGLGHCELDGVYWLCDAIPGGAGARCDPNTKAGTT